MKEKTFFELLAFEDYTRRFLFSEDDASDFYQFDEDQLIVKHRDGRTFLYDHMNKTRRPITLGLRRDDLSEERWRYEFSQRLRKKMDISGIGQELLSRKTGISRPMISNYMRGKAVPSLYNAEKIAIALHCTISELIRFPY